MTIIITIINIINNNCWKFLEAETEEEEKLKREDLTIRNQAVACFL